MSRHEGNRRKIEFLSQYINAGKEYDEVLESYKFFKNKIFSLQASVLSDMPRNESYLKDKIGGNIAKLEQVELILHNRLTRLQDSRTDVELVIGNVHDSLQRRLLRFRYLDGLKWETVAHYLSYSWQHVHRLHSAALKNVIINML